ncbi:MAG TPA: NAD-dependent succinate-semialdehyde dehydrogenase [Thermoanaerobaculia bacterium]|nr:NAD-dependent succinate-semialdehyde dehydrogenase [Thermoanaerobaculia bacterium]
MAIASVNPATGETLRTFTPLTEPEVERRVALGASAFPRWRATSFAERAGVVSRAADALEARKQELGRIMTLEMGKPIGSAVAEAEKCAWVCRYYAESAERFLADEPVATDARRSYVRYEPLGPVLAVMPWNFPFWQVFRFAAPALMAGNVGLLKHASNVPQCALAIEEVFRDAGAPEGVFQTLLVGSDRVAALVADPRIAAVTLTGSEGAGVSVGREAGAQIKKAVLELGGSDPFIVMPSADLAAAVSTAVKARTINNGQSCIAAKRFIVHEKIAAEFERLFVEKMAALKIGDPTDPSVEIGPLATPAIAAEVDDLVQKSVRAGARLALGGKRLDRPGSFYAPTVLADVPAHSPAANEEIFGPVASLFRVKSLDEAIAVANQTRFGLGASAWTRDDAERDRLVRGIEAGAVFVNGMVKSDPRLPFGGVKKSGFGRELSEHGIREFVNVKTVWEG